MRLTDAGQLGFAETHPGQAGYHMWNSQASLDAYWDDLSDLAGLGGTPYEDHDWEDGIEAPPRPIVRSPQTEWSVEPQPLPSPELMMAWAHSDAPIVSVQVLEEAARAELYARERERERLEAEQREAETRRRYARVKRQLRR